MKLEDQVCNLELAKKLYDLGVRNESLFYYGGHDGGEIELLFCPNFSDQPTENHYDWEVPTFTVAELGELLPERVNREEESELFGFNEFNKRNSSWIVEYKYMWEIEDKNEANSRAKMLIYLLENKLI